MAKIKYRVGIDLGANSLGWCAYRLDDNNEPIGILRMGVRIFSDGRDPKSLASLAQDRRLARQMRRRRDRVLKRRRRLLAGLVRFGLMPATESERHALQTLDPFELRSHGLDKQLTPFELGRALYHLARKRGFRSSRKDRGNTEIEKETGKVKDAIARLRSRVTEAGCRTVGEYLARQHAERLPVRARRSNDGQYVLYLQRDMVAEEFDALWNAQARYHPALLTNSAHDYLLDTMLFQRKLRPVQPGRCQFEPDEPRAPLCSPIQQRFRILQELNNLRIIADGSQRALSSEERNTLASYLSHNSKCTFPHARKLLGIGRMSGVKFNLESEKRKDLKGDIVSAQLSASEAVGSGWFTWPENRQQDLAELVERADDDGSLVATLRSEPWLFSESQATAIARCRLPEEFGSLSLKALRRIVPVLEREVIPFSDAVTMAGYSHHSNFYTGEVFRQLPYYGEILAGYTSPTETAQNSDERRFGKIPNPTVHVGLNQLRQLINALIKRYGHPYEIVIEMTREFGVSGERRREIEKVQTENQDRNARFNEELQQLGQRANRINRLKLQLWEELGGQDALDRHCVYSGRRLSKSLLFSDEVEIDHVLPFSRSLHDGIGNKVLCTRQANRDKGNNTPFEAFGYSPGTYLWEALVQRTSALPGRKSLLFQEGALEKFLDGRDFLDRHLIDTGYLSRAAKQYMTAICPPTRIWVSSGRLTGLLRGKWELSSLLSGDGQKNRHDHRHHALDAAVIALCTRSLIQRLATAAERAEQRGASRLLESLELPWPSFHQDLQDSLRKIVVSHKPDHGCQARLHNETNYGLRAEADRRGTPLVGRRIPLDSLTKAADAEAIADPSIRKELAALLSPLSGGKEIKSVLAAFSTRTGIRRIMVEERLSVIPIRDRRTGEPYRYVKGDANYCYDIFRKEDGSWDGEVISIFRANQRGFVESSQFAGNGRPLVMRIRKGDMMALELNGARKIMRVAKFTDGTISLAEHIEANVDTRDRDKTSGFGYLRKGPATLKPLRARLVGVCPLGFLNDPGASD